jgi:hypothetical protein
LRSRSAPPKSLRERRARAQSALIAKYGREWRFLVNQNKSKALTLNAKKLSQMILVNENFHQTVVLPGN